jgi:hypothetical protein
MCNSTVAGNPNLCLRVFAGIVSVCVWGGGGGEGVCLSTMPVENTFYRAHILSIEKTVSQMRLEME